jgi:hypothetical protein
MADLTVSSVIDGFMQATTKAQALDAIDAIRGTTGSTDNRLLRADGTGGFTVQSSAVTIDDTGNISTPGTITTTASPLTRIAANIDVVSSTTLVTLLSAALAAGESYLIEIIVQVKATDAGLSGEFGAYKITAEWPTAAAIDCFIKEATVLSDFSQTIRISSLVNVPDWVASGGEFNNGEPRAMEGTLELTFTIAVTSAGNFVVKGAQATSNAQATTFLKNSFMRVTKLS